MPRKSRASFTTRSSRARPPRRRRPKSPAISQSTPLIVIRHWVAMFGLSCHRWSFFRITEHDAEGLGLRIRLGLRTAPPLLILFLILILILLQNPLPKNHESTLQAL